MSLSLTPELERLVEDEVKLGRSAESHEFLNQAIGIVSVALLLCASFPVFAQEPAVSPRYHVLAAAVPFVGCRSDGQVGPMTAPHGKSKIVPIASEVIQRLAYYESAQGFGVLAPRGWHCFGFYGSGGDTLYVSPEPIGAARIFARGRGGFAGPAVEIALRYGGTSGRFEVASVIARVFPAHRAFVRSVTDERSGPAHSFPFGPYPADNLTYKSKELVEYETPAGTEGLGTISELKMNASPIRGAAILLGKTPDLLLLSVRLSPDLTELTPAIIQQVEHDVRVSHN